MDKTHHLVDISKNAKKNLFKKMGSGALSGLMLDPGLLKMI